MQWSLFCLSPVPEVFLAFFPTSLVILELVTVLMFDNLSSHLCPTPAPLIPAEVQGLGKRAHSLLFDHTLTLCCLLFHSQIQGMTALPPDIERPYKAEPLMCPSPASSLHRSLSLQLLVCVTVLGSILSSLRSWS